MSVQSTNGFEDITDYTISDFFAMNIEKLRDVAAFLGVESPTKKSKKELVELAYQAKCGVLQSEQGKNGRGRRTGPAKGNYYIDWHRILEQRDKFNGLAQHGIYSNRDNVNAAGNSSSGQGGFNDSYVLKDRDGVSEDTNRRQDTADNVTGVLDILADGYGFIRVKQYEPDVGDVYVNPKVIRRFNLRRGDTLVCEAKKQFEDKPAAVSSVISVNGVPIEQFSNRPYFEDLVPIYPNERFVLESAGKTDISARCIDLVCPIGRGQRSMVVAPPKAGKTTLIKSIAKSIRRNYPDVKMYILLIGERPEEVTDMQREVDCEVVYSTFDDTSEHHIKVSEVVIERAKRSVEQGEDVVIVMDSLTRLTRAYNDVSESSGRTLSGGIDPQALYPAKKFFGAARNIENGGSLTIIATALVDTGSRMDDVIYEEFKGTGNMEVHLSRRLSEIRIFPAIDIAKSATRREELLLSQKELDASYVLHRMLNKNEYDGTRDFLKMVLATKNNSELCDQLILYSRQMDRQ